MLFNSIIFIAEFLPVVLIGFYWIGRRSTSAAAFWLALASLFFYGWWDVRYLGLLVGSIAFNYAAGYAISRSVSASSRYSKSLLICSVAADLTFLAYYKYASFLAENINRVFGSSLPFGEIFLPLGISFFTFTQIAFLVDTYQGKVKEYNFIHYLLFVTYFPHLIAGPVLHHKEMMPQFADRDSYRFNPQNFSAGLAIFVLALAKKVFLADWFGDLANPIFSAVSAGGHPMLIEAWIGALAYTFQLYFDFSAYSDMAIGLSLMFNVRLPMNFDSPYKSTSIIDFWRRWHMTLSRFLRDYLYIPLGGSHKGNLRRYVNLMLTMLLGGLWHGAGWTFVIWGGLHGTYLLINHAWRSLKTSRNWKPGGAISVFSSGALTFFAVVIGWVVFRAENMTTAVRMLRGMFGLNGIRLPETCERLLVSIAGGASVPALQSWGVEFRSTLSLTQTPMSEVILAVGIGFAAALLFPNICQIVRQALPTLSHLQHSESQSGIKISALLARLQWQPTRVQGAVYGCLFFLVLNFLLGATKSEFLYFQF